MSCLIIFLFSLLPREYHAVWLTTYLGLDWPQHTATTPKEVAQQQADLTTQLDALQQAGINTILFQTRLRGSWAAYSPYEPYDRIFTGRAGQTPLYDPLAFAIAEAHRRGMELHAWIVTFPIGKTNEVKALGKNAVAKQHPELCLYSRGQYFLNPGLPNTATYLARLCADLTRRYDIDGIHLDYIRYPEKTIPLNDHTTYLRYGQGKDKASWRRENVTHVVKTIHDSVKHYKPWVKLSCSPVGKYDDLPLYSSGGWNAYHAVSQDAVRWVNEGLMDILFPMLYFDGNNFYPFALDWQERVTRGVVAPGLGLYTLAPREGNRSLEDMQRQLNFIRAFHFGGYALFRSRFLTNNTKDILPFVTDYNTPHLLPPSLAPHLDLPSPKVKGQRKGFALRFDISLPSDTLMYNIYRQNEDEQWVLLSARQTATTYWLRPALPSLLHRRYAFTTYDRYGRESQPTELVVVGE